jgi:hypothetical protein
MGAINYKTSDFITIGYNCNFIDYDEEFYLDIIQDYYEQINYLLKKEYFYYFNVRLIPGYYEGFTIDIEFNFSVCFDGYEDKKLAQKEITQLKAFLMRCINEFECCVVYPGWCMNYLEHKESISELNIAIKNMRHLIDSTPTWLQYQKEGA